MFDMCTIATLATFADILFDLLAKFEIPLSKVFSITTDTAKNATNTSDAHSNR